MKTLEESVAETARDLVDAGLSFGQGSDSADDESVWMVYSVLTNPEPFDQLDWQRRISASEYNQLRGLVDQRCTTGTPLAYILGEMWFGGYKFLVDDRVIIPRSFLVEWISDRFRPWIQEESVHQVLDMCTGCGCLGISVAHAFPDASVTLSDISSDALEVAKSNIDLHDLDERVIVSQGDMFEKLDSKYDLIVCNPPYVSSDRMQSLPKEFRMEPALAFDGGDDGLVFIENFLRQSHNYLTENGCIVLEAGSASSALEARYPTVPFLWLGTEYDELVITLINRGELIKYREAFGF
ncbi:MAG: 50S ribosomal protein L3 N(5)-glutamine methyltransferase [Pseudomonadota bacterium]